MKFKWEDELIYSLVNLYIKVMSNSSWHNERFWRFKFDQIGL